MKVNVNFRNPNFYILNLMDFSSTLIILFVPLVLTIVTIITNAVTTDFSNPDTSSIPNEVTKSILRLWVHKGRKDFITFLNRNFEHFYLFWFRWILALLVSELLQWIWQNLDCLPNLQSLWVITKKLEDVPIDYFFYAFIPNKWEWVPIKNLCNKMLVTI